MNQLKLAVVMVLLVPACTMDPHESEMAAALEDTRAEASRHEGACLAADSPGAIRSEAEAHSARMGELTGRMNDAMGRMHKIHCEVGDMEDLMGTIDAIQSVAKEHKEELPVDPVDAQRDCASYRARVVALCDRALTRDTTMICGH